MFVIFQQGKKTLDQCYSYCNLKSKESERERERERERDRERERKKVTRIHVIHHVLIY